MFLVSAVVCLLFSAGEYIRNQRIALVASAHTCTYSTNGTNDTCTHLRLFLLFTAVYHLCGTANERWHMWLGYWDFAGIVSLIVGSSTPVIHYGFGPTLHTHRQLYHVATFLFGMVVIVCSVTTWFNSDR